MNRSESVKEIAPAFLAAQVKMRAAPKDASNPHFGSRYSDFAAVVEAVKVPLNEHGIAYLQPVRLTEHGVEIETVLMHKSGEYFSDTLAIPLNKRDAQAVGSAISYGKRYALQSICGLPSDDDDGNAASEGKPAQRQQQAAQRAPQRSAPPEAVAGASPSQVAELKALLAKVKLPDGTTKAWFAKAGVNRFEDFTADAIGKCIAFAKRHQQQPEGAAA